MKKNIARLFHTLGALVDEYILNCEPVSSRILNEKYMTDISSATLRLDLLKLEKQNLISQPHTSAGRIPTISGYRRYLEHIAPEHKNVRYERMDTLRELLVRNYKDTPRALHYIMQMLAHETDQLSFVAEPEVSSGYLSRLEVFAIEEQKLLFLMSLDSGLDKTVIMKCDYEINEVQLKKLVRYLNDELVGQRVYEISNKVLVEMRERRENESDLLSNFLSELHKAFIEISDFFIHYDGSIKFLEQPEFDSKEAILNFMNMIQRQDVLLNSMRRNDEGDVTILMGEDFIDPKWHDFALIYGKYEVFGIPGYLGVLTPLRAEYRKLIPLIRDVTNTITQTTRKGMVVPKWSKNE
ncbi:MAG: heat-inducible transcriptional repressor HrcA [Candidatus Cloacimonadaceae bacterium]|jgi:heat-inducible transcriptional repressor|nr:heat-inducible transcriptional repressor HrcA [Candidatus Cloacimonadota bacterium]MCK9241646.1 heat-inducible transcriptional repressor HrcA [Candidatus Cloacimonadota bacterium]MDD3102580.1 heat-inducible transcriptional repressor HrcA [Candidatus Cloacimonadota bacterium]MDD3532789.1 heat-inducible transcriptional repressor HrcA [Candidatus Cloacimonadota bacterium]MDY0126825.1 heat-inducible transcriptional repressor HrcA [Candidatus Cloacimonadaceae bacterium]